MYNIHVFETNAEFICHQLGESRFVPLPVRMGTGVDTHFPCRLNPDLGRLKQTGSCTQRTYHRRRGDTTSFNVSGKANAQQFAVTTVTGGLLLGPEIIILGTGSTQVFPPPQVTGVLRQSGVGVEIMANDAACRTFNVLLSEDRRVVLALIQARPAGL